jgi:hypothetical protein
MKRILLISILSFLGQTGFSQSQMLIGLYGGAGASTLYNYDVAISGGLSFSKQFGDIFIGAGVCIPVRQGSLLPAWRRRKRRRNAA